MDSAVNIFIEYKNTYKGQLTNSSSEHFDLMINS